MLQNTGSCIKSEGRHRCKRAYSTFFGGSPDFLPKAIISQIYPNISTTFYRSRTVMFTCHRHLEQHHNPRPRVKSTSQRTPFSSYISLYGSTCHNPMYIDLFLLSLFLLAFPYFLLSPSPHSSYVHHRYHHHHHYHYHASHTHTHTHTYTYIFTNMQPKPHLRLMDTKYVQYILQRERTEMLACPPFKDS